MWIIFVEAQMFNFDQALVEKVAFCQRDKFNLFSLRPSCCWPTVCSTVRTKYRGCGYSCRISVLVLGLLRKYFVLSCANTMLSEQWTFKSLRRKFKSNEDCLGTVVSYVSYLLPIKTMSMKY